MADDENEAVQDHESPGKRKHRILEEAVLFFKNLKKEDNLRGNVKLQLSLENIIKHSMSHGLSSEHINDLMKVIINPHHKLSQGIRTKLVKCLIPCRKVPQTAAVLAVLAISSKIFSSPGPSNLHSILLRWLLLIFDHLEGFDQLHNLYNIIFTFVNSYLLLPQACHLLFLLTRKHDVKLYKVHQLLELSRKLGPEPCIMGLLFIYKVYCPHLVTMRLDYSNKVFFKAHDSTWRSTIMDVVSQQQQEPDEGEKRSATEIAYRRGKERRKSKQQKLLVPEAHAAAMEVDPESSTKVVELSDESSKIPYTQIDTFSNFLENLDKIEYPSQIAAALSDTRLQLLLSCNPDPVVMARLCFWIQHVLTFGFREKSKSETEKFEKLLQMLQTFSPNVQCLPVVEGFLTRYLPTWDGQACASMIFSLITCIRPSSFQDLFSGILEPLHRLFFSSDIYFKSMCVTALTKLLHNQVMHILVPPGESQDGRSRQTVSGAASTNQHFSSSQASQDSSQEEDSVGKGKGSVDSGPAGEASKRWPGGLDITSTTTVDESAATEIILKLIKFLDTVVVVAMRMEDDHYLLQHVTLDFLHLTSQICQKYTVPVVCLPIQVIHRLLFSDCPATLARLCNIINLFREAFSKVPSTMASSSMMMGEMSNGRRVFNSLLLDTLGMLWQGRMFSDRGQKYPSIFSFTLPRELKPKVQENALTVYLGPAFMGLAYKFLKETQPEGKKVHPALIEDFKDQYLQFLERENFPEFKELVNKNIKNRKASVPAKVAS